MRRSWKYRGLYFKIDTSFWVTLVIGVSFTFEDAGVAVGLGPFTLGVGRAS